MFSKTFFQRSGYAGPRTHWNKCYSHSRRNPDCGVPVRSESPGGEAWLQRHSILKADWKQCLGSRDIVRKKRTEITIEIDELMVVKSHRQGTVRIWCPACSTEVTMVTPEQAAAITAASVRTINHWVESGMVHFNETPDGLLLLCADSLQANKGRGTH